MLSSHHISITMLIHVHVSENDDSTLPWVFVLVPRLQNQKNFKKFKKFKPNALLTSHQHHHADPCVRIRK